MGCKSSKEIEFSIVDRASKCAAVRQGGQSLAASTEVPTQRRRRSLSQILLSAPKLNENKHRDVFSIFGERGMDLTTPEQSKSQVLEALQQKPSKSSQPLDSPMATSSSCRHEEPTESADPQSPLKSCSSSTTTASLYETNSNTIIQASNSSSTSSDRFIPQLSLRYGACSDQGMRKTNEDRKVCVYDTIKDHDVAYFGIYDGHGGDKVAQFLAENLHETVFDCLLKQNDQQQDLDDGIRKAFEATDDTIFTQQLDSGSTAVAVLIRDQEAVIASIGDSQAVLSSNNQAVLLSMPHKPDLSSEKARILAAKGTVVKGRIFGLLEVSRAFGDNDFKTSRGQFKDRFNGDLVTSSPDIRHHQIDEEDQFIVLGCDGLFDVMTPQEVVDFVRLKLLLNDNGVQQVCDELVAHAISLGSTDNVSAIVVCLNAD